MTQNLPVKSKPDVSRVVAILICIALVLACLAYDYWRRDLPAWWREHGGGIPYVRLLDGVLVHLFPLSALHSNHLRFCIDVYLYPGIRAALASAMAGSISFDPVRRGTAGKRIQLE